MPEFENKEDKSASENAKALKYIFKLKMKSMKEEKWKNKALHGKYPRILEKPHVDMVTTNKWLSSNLKGEIRGTTFHSSRPGNKHHKLPEIKLCVASKWRANAECVCKMKRQWIIWMM